MTQSHQAPAFVTLPPRRLLFLCVHNSARSQMAEGFARKAAPPDASCWSAGSKPTRVHPLAIEVMKEIGIDISGHVSKPIDAVPWADADTIVSVCGESEAECPAVGGSVRRVHWPLPDPAAAPAERQLEAFRTARDEIRWRVSSLWPSGD